MSEIRKSSLWGKVHVVGSQELKVSVLRAIDVDDSAIATNRRAMAIILAGALDGSFVSWRLDPNQARRLACYLNDAAASFEATE